MQSHNVAGFSYPQKFINVSYIFSLVAKSDMQGTCVIFRQSRSYRIFAFTFPTGKISLCVKQNIMP